MIKLVAFLIFSLFLSIKSISAPLEIAIIHNTPDQKVAAEILTVIYQELDISVVFIELPGKRALAQSSKGKLDGEAQRIYEIGEIYTDLIRVPTSFITWGVAAFSKPIDFEITSWRSLKGYKVTMVRGMKYAEIGLRDAGVDKVGILSDVGEMMAMLQLDFVDFAISSHFNGLVQLKRLKLNAIKPNQPNLDNLKLYHYLHIKHKKLVPQLDAVIRSMKNNGELIKLKEKFKQELLSNIENSA